MLSKDEILKADDLVKELVDVPEWSGSVYVRTMSGAEREKFEDTSKRFKGKTLSSLEYLVSLLVSCLCDDKGKLLFTEADIKPLTGKNTTIIMRLYDVALRMNGLRADDVKELAKNSDETPAEDSSSS